MLWKNVSNALEKLSLDKISAWNERQLRGQLYHLGILPEAIEEVFQALRRYTHRMVFETERSSLEKDFLTACQTVLMDPPPWISDRLLLSLPLLMQPRLMALYLIRDRAFIWRGFLSQKAEIRRCFQQIKGFPA